MIQELSGSSFVLMNNGDRGEKKMVGYSEWDEFMRGSFVYNQLDED